MYYFKKISKLLNKLHVKSSKKAPNYLDTIKKTLNRYKDNEQAIQACWFPITQGFDRVFCKYERLEDLNVQLTIGYVIQH